jgi:hypothetical protein
MIFPGMEICLGILQRVRKHVRYVTRNKDTMSYRLKYGSKECYMCHRRWLPRDHVWRQERELFDGTEEHRLEPEEMSKDQLLQQLIHVENLQFGKYNGNKRKHMTSDGDVNESNWRKKSIFFKVALLVNIETTT